MKKWYNLFVWITLIFLVYALYKGDYFIRPNVKSQFDLAASFLLLFTAFIIQGASWKILLKKYELKISNRNGIIAFGISVFGKYFPGKIWMLLGKVGYTKLKYNFPIDILMVASINAQFISLWVGLLIGIPFLFFVSIPFAIRIINYLLSNVNTGDKPILNSIMFLFLFVSSVQFLLFAMWMDIQDNERLYH